MKKVLKTAKKGGKPFFCSIGNYVLGLFERIIKTGMQTYLSQSAEAVSYGRMIPLVSTVQTLSLVSEISL